MIQYPKFYIDLGSYVCLNIYHVIPDDSKARIASVLIGLVSLGGKCTLKRNLQGKHLGYHGKLHCLLLSRRRQVWVKGTFLKCVEKLCCVSKLDLPTKCYLAIFLG